MNNLKEMITKTEQCPSHYILALIDTMNVINGKWKLPIIASLLREKCRFKDIQESVQKITPRMLSKELKELELNGIVKRVVYNKTPVLIEYSLTPSGENMTSVIEAMIKWGTKHREQTIITNEN